MADQPRAGSWIKIGERKGRPVLFVTTYRGYWLIKDGGQWELVDSEEPWRLAEKDEMYFSGTNTWLFHVDFEEVVKIDESYSDHIAHYVFVEHLKACDQFYLIRNCIKTNLEDQGHEILEIMSNHKERIRPGRLLHLMECNKRLIEQYQQLEVAAEAKELWDGRRSRIDANRSRGHLTSGFPNLHSLLDSVKEGEDD